MGEIVIKEEEGFTPQPTNWRFDRRSALLGAGAGILLSVTGLAVNDSLKERPPQRLLERLPVPGFAWDDSKYPPVPNPPIPYRPGESSCGFTPTFRELSPGVPSRIGVIVVAHATLERAFMRRGTADFRLGFMYRHANAEPQEKCGGDIAWRQGMGPVNTIFGSITPGAYDKDGNVLWPTGLAAAIAIGVGNRNLEIAWAMRVEEETIMLATSTIDISGDIETKRDGTTPLSDLHRFPQGLPVLGPPPTFDPIIGA